MIERERKQVGSTMAYGRTVRSRELRSQVSYAFTTGVSARIGTGSEMPAVHSVCPPARACTEASIPYSYSI